MSQPFSVLLAWGDSDPQADAGPRALPPSAHTSACWRESTSDSKRPFAVVGTSGLAQQWRWNLTTAPSASERRLGAKVPLSGYR